MVMLLIICILDQTKNADKMVDSFGVFFTKKIYYETTTLGIAAMPLCAID